MEKLPEKWAIQAKVAYEGEIGEWFNKQVDTNCYIGFNQGYLHSHNASGQYIINTTNKKLDASFHDTRLRPGFTLITEEDFRTLLMNISMRLPEPFIFN